ncbi:MAG TPA: hypothetical protein VFW33_21240 [Gemmataceae bacterium]|nr:hypothetical protein [Gemmataceae bacterium]
MPISVTCRHCGAVYPVTDDLRGRTLLCRECDRPVVVEDRGRPPLRWAVRAVVILLALLPSAALGALWWTGWLWDYADWPSAREPPPGDFGSAVTFHLAGVDRIDSWDELTGDLARLRDDGPSRYFSASTNGDRATVVLAPVKDPEALAGRIDFGTVRRVRGRVITVSLRGGGRHQEEHRPPPP